jgi:thermolysin
VTLPGRQSWNYLAGGLDVIGHELTHGVTEFSSNLIYENESGALNEAFSDIMGTSIEFFYQPTGTGVMQADYAMGEDVITPGGLRSLSNPALFGDPDHYTKRYIGNQDNGGVHTNATIATHAFYLAIEGGTNRTSGIAVTGIGAANREQMEKVFYRGFTQLMPANATFAVARTVTIQAARDLYGAGGAVERAVTQAWTAVGVN